MANVTEMPPVEAPETVDTTPEPAKPAKPAPPKKQPERRSGPEPRFFDKVASVPKADWGTRAFMYVYADEPVCNAKTFGTTRYMLKSSAPILDLEGLKQDYGSFKGWMTLNLRKTGKDQTDEVDRYEFEIYDPKHPPKIPKSAWANDARNKKWLDLLPPEKPEPVRGAGMSEFVEVLRATNEIRKDIREELQPAQTAAAPAAAAPPSAPDPFDTAKKIMDMRTNDPMIALLMARMDAQDKAAEAARQREYELQKELRQKESAAPAPQKGLLEQVVELASLGDKLEPVKKLFGLGGSVAETVTRAGRTTVLDVTRELGREFLHSEFAIGIGQWLGSLATRQQQPQNGNGMNGNAQPQQQQQIADPFQRFIQDVVNPKMLMFFNDEPNKEGGEAFADWLWAGFPEYFERLQNFNHPRLPGMQGAAAILTGYKNTPHIWQQIGPTREVAFSDFVNAFCAWKAPTDEDVPDAEVITPDSEATVDFDAEEVRPS
jgi:hypothetical protein